MCQSFVDLLKMSENIDWKKCTVAELRDHCTKHGLVATGKKVELVERLEEYQAAQMLDIKGKLHFAESVCDCSLLYTAWHKLKKSSILSVVM